MAHTSTVFDCRFFDNHLDPLRATASARGVTSIALPDRPAPLAVNVALDHFNGGG
jgi:hypothetical protein